MQIVESKPFAVTILAVFMLLTSVQQAIAAPVEKVLHKFPGSGGKVPYGKLAVDAKGNLYGTTLIGGPANAGTVFKLHQLPDGTWNGRVIHGFTDTNNSIPAPGVVFDASGNLYGATTRTIFELIPPASGNGLWSEKVLYTFCLTYPCIDGALPSSVIFDPAGNLYGTTESGGLYGLGTVFELTPDASGNWTEKVLYSFNPFGSNDGTNPSAPLVRDAAGNLYGTTVFGTGTAYFGTAFELSPQADGTWAETVIHDFCSSKDCEDGLQPRHGLLLDQAGNLYGSADFGGGSGVVFKLTQGSNGNWTESVLHYLNGATEGYLSSELIFDAPGNLYAAMSGGGAFNQGTIFELKTSRHGGWSPKVLYTFVDNGDGSNPEGALIFDQLGNLYGTAGQRDDPNNCSKGCGVVFEIVR